MLGFYYKDRQHYWYLFIELNKKLYQTFWTNYNLNNWIELKYNQIYQMIEKLKEKWFIEDNNF